jgi:hypothetical protein
VGTNGLKILLSAKVVKGKIILRPHYSGQVADFHLKYSMLMENPQNNISGRNIASWTPVLLKK